MFSDNSESEKWKKKNEQLLKSEVESEGLLWERL